MLRDKTIDNKLIYILFLINIIVFPFGGKSLGSAGFYNKFEYIKVSVANEGNHVF